MPQKRVPPPRKDPSPAPSSSYTSSEEEEEEGNHNTDPKSSQPPAKKPTSDLNQTPNSDSSTEEEDDEEEEVSEHEKDVRSQSKPAQEKEDDEEEDSDESGSDSDSPPPNVKSARPSPRGADLNGKPISSDNPKPKKGAAAASPASSPAPKPSPQKRSAAPNSSEKESKKRQKPDLDVEESPKKPLFQRIWSTEDEISVLNAMIEFAKRGSDVSSDLTGFHKFVQKSLSVDLTKSQVSEKIRRMKKKYQNFAKKGKEPSFSKDGENLVYELSKKIWGNDGEQGGNPKRSKNTVKPKSPPPSKSENHNHGLKNIEVLYPHLNDSLHLGGIVSVGGFGDVDVRRAITLMTESRAKEWDERWMKLRSKEKAIHMERATLAYELMKELYDVDRRSKEMGDFFTRLPKKTR